MHCQAVLDFCNDVPALRVRIKLPLRLTVCFQRLVILQYFASKNQAHAVELGLEPFGDLLAQLSPEVDTISRANNGSTRTVYLFDGRGLVDLNCFLFLGRFDDDADHVAGRSSGFALLVVGVGHFYGRRSPTQLLRVTRAIKPQQYVHGDR